MTRLYWKVYYWWFKPKVEREIWDVLSQDQCQYGFEHTADEIIYWLSQSTYGAHRVLYRKLSERIAEFDNMRARGKPWHHDERQWQQGSRCSS